MPMLFAAKGLLKLPQLIEVFPSHKTSFDILHVEALDPEGQKLVVIGDGLRTLAIPLLVFHLTGSALSLGITYALDATKVVSAAVRARFDVVGFDPRGVGGSVPAIQCLTGPQLDKFFDFHEILKDVAKRPFITAGFTAFVLLLPLAVTSTSGWIRRLGGRRWQRLHRLIYVTAIAAVVHYYWLVKSDIRLPVFYGALVALLFAYRIVAWAIDRRPHPATPRRSKGAAPAIS